MKSFAELLAEYGDRWSRMNTDERLGCLLLIHQLSTEDAVLFKLADWDQLPSWLQKRLVLIEGN